VRPLALEEIVGLDRYGELRTDHRRAVIAHKRSRRVSVGEKVTLVFEDRETLRFQVQEMLFVEGIRDPELVQQELDVYNELVPGEHELSATLFVEITDSERIRSELDELIGIDEHVWLVLGEDGDAVHARFDPKQMEEDRISAVQYLKFPLDAAQVSRFADPSQPVLLRIDHPRYHREVELAPAVRESLRVDLTGEPEPLLRGGAAPAADAEILSRGRVRAWRPAHPLAPGHLVVETSERVDWLEADADLHGELWAVLRELAGQVAEQHGSCRIWSEAGPGRPLRWHLAARG
jgi:hypothetical protein